MIRIIIIKFNTQSKTQLISPSAPTHHSVTKIILYVRNEKKAPPASEAGGALNFLRFCSYVCLELEPDSESDD